MEPEAGQDPRRDGSSRGAKPARTDRRRRVTELYQQLSSLLHERCRTADMDPRRSCGSRSDDGRHLRIGPPREAFPSGRRMARECVVHSHPSAEIDYFFFGSANSSRHDACRLLNRRDPGKHSLCNPKRRAVEFIAPRRCCHGRRPSISSPSGDFCSSATIRKCAAPRRTNATACTANEPRLMPWLLLSATALGQTGSRRPARRLRVHAPTRTQVSAP